MKIKCKLCSQIFEEEDFDVENIHGEIIVSCPNACILYKVCVKDFGDIEIKEEK